ncbi:Septin-domain-containing protein [Trametes elegans]|nr:Septin-domain-containing protein [Trametes elegans]
MFTFRRKPQKKAADDSGPPFIRTSPSLPELSAQGIPWPSNLVDLSQLPPDTAKPAHPPRGAAKTSFTADSAAPVPFHKPWSSPGRAVDSPTGGGPISSLYMSHPPSAFETRKGSIPGRPRPSQRRARNPTTFNIMVAGAQGTGKTSLLRLLLDTADVSPTATADQKAALGRFLRGAPKRTDAIQTACVEICESKYDRLLLSVIDTPGLDFQDGRELKLERQVNAIVKYLDAQFSDTLNEESKVVRQSKGDQHIHLCIYMIDPSSVMTESARRAQSSLPTKTRSETTISYKPPDLSSMSDDSDSEDSDDESAGGLTMSPADIRVIRRLSARANVLPVIARADSLTDSTLAAIKHVVRRDLLAANLDFGVFGPVPTPGQPQPHRAKSPDAPAPANGSTNGDAAEHSDDEAGGGGGSDERPSRPVIKLRPTRLARTRSSRSRSRLDLAEPAEEPALELNDGESVASVRFSAHIVAKTDLGALLPFAVITPEHSRRHRREHVLKTAAATAASASSAASANGHAHINGPHPGANGADEGMSVHAPSPSEDGHAPSIAPSSVTSPVSPSTPGGSVRNFAYLAGPPADLRGVFVRKYRWGTVDVLAPEHCDFAALRTAVLSTHMKMLKIRTKEVLYEKYRTEKLLARRATRNIGEDETRKLLEDLGL